MITLVLYLSLAHYVEKHLATWPTFLAHDIMFPDFWNYNQITQLINSSHEFIYIQNACQNIAIKVNKGHGVSWIPPGDCDSPHKQRKLLIVMYVKW